MRVGTGGTVHMSGSLALAVGAGVVGADSPSVGRAEGARDPLVLDSRAELGDGAGVGVRAGGRRSCSLGRTRARGLKVLEELFKLGNLGAAERGELGIGRDEGFEYGLFVGHGRCHVV